MPRRRPSPTYSRFIDVIKRNKWKSLATAIAIIGGIPSAWAGIEFFAPWLPTTHQYIDNEAFPKRDHIIDYLLQQQALRALADAEADMLKAPNPTTQATIGRLKKSIERRQNKLDHDNGRDE